MECKYIIVDGCAVLFSKALTHADVARALPPVESAGFCNTSYDQKEEKFVVNCYGKSESLKIGSDPKDGLSIARQLFNYY